MSGFVRIHRALIGHPAFRNDAEAMAFAWLVAKAAWKPCRVRYKERGVCLQRGQVAVSVRDFANAMDRDKAWIERLLKRLKGETMVEVRHETGVNVITICNYAQYQDARDRAKTPDETPHETDARQTQDTEQRIEEVKEVSSVSNDTSPRPWACPVGVNPQVWKDFLSNRKRKRQGNTDTAWKKFNDDLARVSVLTGIPPPKLIEMCAAEGWGGIYDPTKEARNERPDNPTALAVQRLTGTFGPHG